MALQSTCPCPHDPSRRCPCDTLAYSLTSNDSDQITEWQKSNSLIQVRRTDSQSIRIQANIEYQGDIPPLNGFGYNTALRLETTADPKVIYIGFAVTEDKGKILIQAVTPLPIEH